MIETLDALAAKIGFGLWGVADAAPAPAEEAARSRAWFAAGRAGEMGWLADSAEARLGVEAVLPGARSVVIVADSYGNTQPAGGSADRPEVAARNGSVRGRIARYAWGRDYHRVLKKKLHRLGDGLAAAFPDAAFRACVDTAPLDERRYAEAAGLGWRGKNSLLIHPRHGSFVLLGALLTTLELPTSAARGFPGPLAEPTDRCANCTRCIDACPTGAIDAGGHAIDPRRCISYLTIERRSVDPPGAAPDTHGWLAGCDVCQDVCPFNAIGTRHPLPVPLDFAPRPHAAGLDPAEVAGWTRADRLAATAGTALIRIKLPMWKRNAEAAEASRAASSKAEDAADLRQSPKR
ncbi:tRNA epoxyqueuosine(34) reductase QueG [Phycisphaera mikurensis]|uniref:4Fe-4S ferredoxin-type domain-containing protein n=1 Tax=Phycisphaera mikurensis (strain NBRC 102666 / KCTC 22515 / FYK2301M01) TaxID=1142394 RepID=I0ID47_PHYMF|nr:tRNA epoxyqueuosine(34) reductase QueG [Phycisphaera mikurensis]MBB6442309.1 epoxyqueuosine reductase [Phycisphaera mikurensis]BAM03185.1 hypothetical protein PSMK_10260 [Phycisphaera mikurensis NBRC 102666]